MKTFILATRPSALARWQTSWVISAIQTAYPGLECVEKIITTEGDRILNRPLPEIGGKGVFTQELEENLIKGDVHAAVHSLKDLPVEQPPGLTIGAIPRRGEVRDVMISANDYSLESLPAGAKVGTSSLRRAAQLRAKRPDLRIESLRGNVDTRIRKAMDHLYDAIVVAGVGVVRLGLENYITQWLSLSDMLPAPGQGALAVQCRQDDEETLTYLSKIEDAYARLCTQSERAFLAALGGGCAVPVAAYAEVRAQSIELQGLVASEDGRKVIRCSAHGTVSQEVGELCAQQAIAQGAKALISH
jgi:hydroxymethylbilane synthase